MSLWNIFHGDALAILRGLSTIAADARLARLRSRWPGSIRSHNVLGDERT